MSNFDFLKLWVWMHHCSSVVSYCCMCESGLNTHLWVNWEQLLFLDNWVPVQRRRSSKLWFTTSRFMFQINSPDVNLFNSRLNTLSTTLQTHLLLDQHRILLKLLVKDKHKYSTFVFHRNILKVENYVNGWVLFQTMKGMRVRNNFCSSSNSSKDLSKIIHFIKTVPPRGHIEVTVNDRDH